MLPGSQHFDEGCVQGGKKPWNTQHFNGGEHYSSINRSTLLKLSKPSMTTWGNSFFIQFLHALPTPISSSSSMSMRSSLLCERERRVNSIKWAFIDVKMAGNFSYFSACSTTLLFLTFSQVNWVLSPSLVRWQWQNTRRWNWGESRNMIIEGWARHRSMAKKNGAEEWTNGRWKTLLNKEIN